MFIEYQSFKFKPDTLAIIEKANEIIDDFEAQGYTLTLRQLYYQFVAQDILENSQKSYDRLGKVITHARMAGLVSWEAIEDNHRTSAVGVEANEDELEALRGIEQFIKIDCWARQENYVEVWVEKDALLGVVERACKRYDVPHMACKGYLSASEAWRAGNRFRDAADSGRSCYLLHLGDHDPSGIDMTRDNGARLDMFAGDGFVEVKRLALNMRQVEKYKPPSNPAKITDSRAESYIATYGKKSWELDALKPQVIDQLVTTNIESLLDIELWQQSKAEQREKRQIITAVHDNWGKVRPMLKKLIKE